MGEEGDHVSYVTGVVLCSGGGEGDDDDNGPCWAQVQDWLISHGFAALTYVDQSFSGTKAPQMIVAGGGFNYFPCDEFRAFVESVAWRDPRRVVLVMQTEDDRTVVVRPDVACLRATPMFTTPYSITED